MAESSTDAVAERTVRPARDLLGPLGEAVRGSFLLKLLAAEAALLATILVLFAVGGDFTSETPSAFGLLAGFLGPIAGILGLVVVIYAVGVAAVRGYSYVSTPSSSPG